MKTITALQIRQDMFVPVASESKIPESIPASLLGIRQVDSLPTTLLPTEQVLYNNVLWSGLPKDTAAGLKAGTPFPSRGYAIAEYFVLFVAAGTDIKPAIIKDEIGFLNNLILDKPDASTATFVVYPWGNRVVAFGTAVQLSQIGGSTYDNANEVFPVGIIESAQNNYTVYPITPSSMHTGSPFISEVTVAMEMRVILHIYPVYI